ncbi:MAG: BLUF domain-containing protein [Bdellovibrionaceae bacterium]|nr:BLUF domain-containing protein [Pseudobdellovibrionaceae bacterium]MBX3033146.1 BLUF domain-containing protein [Pseudobdellovibrionaceae bacterium]
MGQDVFQLVYLSRAVDGISYSDLSDILDRDREFNRRNGLTGILIYRDGFFIQLLEGGEAEVMDAMAERIRDRRHHHVQVVHEISATDRLFGEWAMAFHDGDLDADGEPGLMETLFQLAREARRPKLEIMTPLARLSRRYAI